MSDLGSTNKTQRKSATERLLKAADDSVPVLLRGLGDSRHEVKMRVLAILRQIKQAKNAEIDDPAATEIGRKGRLEKDRSVRLEMVLALRDLRGDAAVAELKRSASEDSDEEVRQLATHHVATVSPANESAFFRKQTGDGSRLVQLAAYTELARLGDLSGRDPALRTLKDSARIGERFEALALLEAVANPSDLAFVKNIADTPASDFQSRARAFRAYKHIQLFQLPEGNRLNSLIKALDDPSEGTRDWAYVELYHSPDSNTNAALKKYLSEPGHLGYKQAGDALNAR